MPRHLRTSVAALGAITAVALAGCGSDSAATVSSNLQKQAAGGTGAPGYPGGPGGFRGGGPGMDLSALAKALGVSQAKLRAAMASARPSGARPSGTPGARPSGTPQPGQRPGGGGQLAATLAKQLGLSEAKVRKALQSVLPQGGPAQGGQPPQSGTFTS
jgi:hypothetical protein